MKRTIRIITIIILAILLTSCEAPIEPTPKPTLSPTEEPTDWKIGSFVDDYGDETGEKYLYNTNCKGYDTEVTIFVSKDSIWFEIEVDGRDINYLDRDKDETIRISFPSNGSESKSARLKYYNGRYYFKDSSDRSPFLNSLKINDELKCQIATITDSVNEYKFKINATGFNRMYNSIR